MSSLGGFEDNHLVPKAWSKKKDTASMEACIGPGINKPVHPASATIKKGGKIILDDELSMSRQMKKHSTQTHLTLDHSSAREQKESDLNLMESHDKLSTSHYSSSKSKHTSTPGVRQASALSGVQDEVIQNLSGQSVPLSASGGSEPASTKGKHNISSAKTAIRSTAGHETSVITGNSGLLKKPIGTKRNFSGHLSTGESSSQMNANSAGKEPTLERSQGSNGTIDSLRNSGGATLSLLRQNEQVLDYMYNGEELDDGLTDSNLMVDIEGTRHLARLNHELDEFLAASNEELAADFTKEELNQQIEKLEQLKIKLRQREEAKKRLEAAAAEFKLRSSQLVDMPPDYEEVADRITQELMAQHQLRRSRMSDAPAIAPIPEESELQEDESPTRALGLHSQYEGDIEQENGLTNDSEILKFVQAKLSSPFYGFAKQPDPTPVEDGDELHSKQLEYLQGIARIRALDKLLREKELEEKAIKKKIRLEREELKQQRLQEIKIKAKQEREALKSAKLDKSQDLSDSRLSEEDRVVKNKSGVSQTSGMSSKSDFFMTQNKKIQSKGAGGQAGVPATVAHIKESPGPVALNKSAWKKTNPLRPSPSVVESVGSEQRAKTAAEGEVGDSHIEKNIREAFNPDRGSYASTLTGVKLERYKQLMNEVDQSMDDPDAIRRQVDAMFLDVYGYPEDLKAKFKDIDDKVREMTTDSERAAMQGPAVDVIRERSEARSILRKIRLIDEQLHKLDSQDEVIDLLDPDVIQQRIAAVSNPMDQQALLGVEQTLTNE